MKTKIFEGRNAKAIAAARITHAQHLQAQFAYGLRLIIPLIGRKFKRLTDGGEM